MKNNTAQQNIPSGWSLKALSHLALIKKGEQLNRLAMDDSGAYPALNGGISPSGYTDKWNTGENTTTISEGGNSCGYVNFNKEKFWCGGHCYALLNLTDEIDNSFLFQSLKSKQDQLMKLRVGSGLPNIQKRSIEEFLVVFPKSKTEQRKIAEILGGVDEDIAKTQEVIEATEKLKRGLMQQLFTRGIGHTKFKETKLGDVCIFQTGKLNSNKAVEGGEYPFFTCAQETFSIDQYSFDQQAVLLAGNNAAGKYSVKYYKGKFDAYQRTYVISVKNERELSYNYLREVLNTRLNELRDSSVGSTTKFLTLKLLQNLPVSLPPIETQKKIAEILSVVDEKISVNKKLKEKLTLLKKGLMQDLLSGRVRTNI